MLSSLLCLFLLQEINAQEKGRERINLNDGWQFMRYEGDADSLIYDERTRVFDRNDNKVADTRATEERTVIASGRALKEWILPSANDFISDPSGRHQRPPGNPGSNFPFVQPGFDDTKWKSINLPHDWAIAGPFYKEENAIVGGGMGRLPVQGVAWYRKKINVPSSDKGRRFYLDIDGAMSYAMIWLNGNLVGGWPYGYNSFRLDLTPFISKQRKLYAGLLLVIVKGKAGKAGKIVLKATSQELQPANLEIRSE
ncbi:sugar-binding domain-containing protein [Pseudoflavitalea rhizosphaerae]|uniref:sugar-binding domain-containing protein n=1 Tax=Pseudoflavitalea rhizosphaerae TaxID=1884793 RepID=UPI001F4981D1|nr:sugar-binding domain-containing protein [Pseudoflavitalea rhizosphaerae]